MRTMSSWVIFLLLAFCLSLAQCAGFADADQSPALSERSSDDSDIDVDNIDKRVERYAFGLGRRAYTYTSGGPGVKRLPVYNFGLGKRARPYSFGLGKRAELDDDYIDFLRNNFQAEYDGTKRSRPYSFGLGKREADISSDVDRRGAVRQRYGFGLGKR